MLKILISKATVISFVFVGALSINTAMVRTGEIVEWNTKRLGIGRDSDRSDRKIWIKLDGSQAFSLDI
jgi:hypothetical protein